MHEGFKCPNPHPLKMNIIFLLFLYVFFLHMYLWSFYMIIIFIQMTLILNYDISESLPFLLCFFFCIKMLILRKFLSENIERIVVQTTHIHPRRIADSNIFICFFVLNKRRNFFLLSSTLVGVYQVITPGCIFHHLHECFVIHVPWLSSDVMRDVIALIIGSVGTAPAPTTPAYE